MLSLEGTSAEKIALSVALGVVFGTFPMYGCPTLLCAAASIVLRLNFPAVQCVNYLISPLQIALLVPFNRVGAGLFPAHASVRHTDIWRLASSSGTAAMHAIVGWFCVGVPLGILLYVTLRHMIRRRRMTIYRITTLLTVSRTDSKTATT
jgi:uncharacterized protein (DUF2062 family)